MDLLSQDEIDALLRPEGEESEKKDENVFDFAMQDRIVRGRMPTLEMVNERFARQLRISLFNMLRRSAEISSGSVQIIQSRLQ